jgi:hypothetical protein
MAVRQEWAAIRIQTAFRGFLVLALPHHLSSCIRFVLCNDLTRIRLCIGAGLSGAACAQGAGAAAGDRAGAAGAEAGGDDAAVHAGAGAGAGAHPGAPRADVHRGSSRAEAARGAPHRDGHPSGRRGHHPLHLNGLRAPTSFI